MITPVKLLLLALAAVVVWHGFRWWTRSARAQPPATSGGAIERTVHCSVCDAYVPAHPAPGCDRADCPYRR